MTERLQLSIPPGILFIERCTQLLVPSWRIGITLPDSILGSPELRYVREWLICNHRIIASIDLHEHQRISHKKGRGGFNLFAFGLD